MKAKPKKEIPVRLKWMKAVKGKLPRSVVAAGEKARAAYQKPSVLPEEAEGEEMTLPPMSSDIALSVFSVTFPRQKPFGFDMHRKNIAHLRFFVSGPFLPRYIREGLLKALRTWSESFAELAGRN